MARGEPGGKRSDPLVPVYSPNLRAAIAEQGFTVASAARQVKENQQTLAHLAAGLGTKRCRRSRRARLAKLLGVTEEWLAEPMTIVLPLYPPAGAKGVVFATGFSHGSPRTQLATGRLLTKCVEACDRDLANPVLRNDGIPETASAEEVRHHLASCVRLLITIEDLRGDLLVGGEGPLLGALSDGTFLRSRHLPIDSDEEAATLNLIGAWEQILEPWFAEEARLNYRRLRERAGFPTPSDERRPDTNPYIIVPKGREGAPRP